MAAETTVHFLSTAWMATALAGGALVGRFAPAGAGRARLALAAGGGLAIACLAALLGVVPWTGPLHLTAYALFLILAFVAAYLLALPRVRGVGLEERDLIGLAATALVAGLAGARIRYVAENWQAFRTSAGVPRPWSEVLADAADLDGGGMVWYGGLVAAVAAVAIHVRLRWPRLGVLAMGDLLAAPVLVGLGIGRIGCWFNGCCFGAPLGSGWGAAIHAHGPDAGAHPTQLYETAACLLLAWLVARIPPARAPGRTAGIACIAYGAWRFLNEGLRGDHHAGCLTSALGIPLSHSQVTSLWLSVVGLLLILAARLAARAPTRPAGTAAG